MVLTGAMKALKGHAKHPQKFAQNEMSKVCMLPLYENITLKFQPNKHNSTCTV